jgi:hypothetical protein
MLIIPNKQKKSTVVAGTLVASWVQSGIPAAFEKNHAIAIRGIAFGAHVLSRGGHVHGWQFRLYFRFVRG